MLSVLTPYCYYRIGHICLRRRKCCEHPQLYEENIHPCHGRHVDDLHHDEYQHGEPHPHPHRAPVFTVDSYMTNSDPVYQDIREIVKDTSEERIDDENSEEKEYRKNKISAVNSSTCAEPSLVYGTIVTKEMARYKPSTPIIIRK